MIHTLNMIKPYPLIIIINKHVFRFIHKVYSQGLLYVKKYCIKKFKKTFKFCNKNLNKMSVNMTSLNRYCINSHICTDSKQIMFNLLYRIILMLCLKATIGFDLTLKFCILKVRLLKQSDSWQELEFMTLLSYKAVYKSIYYM